VPSLTNLIVVVIGTALSMRVRRETWRSASLSVSSASSSTRSSHGQALGHQEAAAALAAWIGNLFFGGLGLELWRRTRRGG
jgi:hypothetical protein